MNLHSVLKKGTAEEYRVVLVLLARVKNLQAKKITTVQTCTSEKSSLSMHARIVVYSRARVRDLRGMSL
jgi:hypothetical protein